MTALKQRSPFFIVGDTKDGMYQWYVLKTGNELLRYEQQRDQQEEIEEDDDESA